MQIFIKLSEGKTLTYITKSENDNIIMMKRDIAKKINMPQKHDIYSLFLTYFGKQLYDHQKIIDTLHNEATIHVIFKCMSGPTNNTIETESVYVNDISKEVQVSYFPNDTIMSIQQQVLEILVNERYVSDDSLLFNFHMRLGDKIIPLNSVTGEYAELSPAFILFNKQDFSNQSYYFGKKIDLDGPYYQIVPIGERKKNKKNLKFYFGKAPYEIICNNNCVSCPNSYNIITPCCRKKICKNCSENCASNQAKCLICHEK
ncbi:ubiquitin family protein [Indivirus ILV1]|uniref:Ubiquitin family protein n=1 Tax=Indivirus ILV1 TaxID=1977633 RepID=A0A1V0SE33_9VIRU|nr:ubiquitin family protein [Indivirus ILV1]